ncbi:hypothetical protein WJX72_010951 [[Myrmecia] bisecta]|uniref:Histone deacetylase domain-containing protein n=1 Tax=[Myrmecia] bisecta TaxID=41462 RepID=A0AAW1P241_9CHLO
MRFAALLRLSPLPEGHRFPMPKDALVYDRLVEVGLAKMTFQPRLPDADTLSLVHDQAYVTSFLDGSLSDAAMRRIGLPWSERLLRRTLIGTGSAVLAARLALQYGVACMTNGGTHHAHAGYGSGWCIFNDLAVAARAAQRDAGIRKVVFVDLDVHQGNGTATIFASDPTVYTFSIHCEAQTFPHKLQHSDWDIALPAGTTNEGYLKVLSDTLPMLLQQERPDLVLYNAGVDVHKDDSLGKMALTDAGILARDRMVFSCCADFQVPVACAIGGGYAPDHQAIVERHVQLHRAAWEWQPHLQQAVVNKQLAAHPETDNYQQADTSFGTACAALLVLSQPARPVWHG